MLDSRWRTIQLIFDKAMLEPVAQRIDFVAEQCGEDEDMRLILEKMLAADQETGILDSPVVGPLKPESISWSAGTHIGPYKLIREIGQGGMSRVFLAVRNDDKYHKQVAIKLMAPSLNKELSRRFRTERQILADLEHPNIARLYDGGETEDGVPYLIMEYIEGEALDDYCNRNSLSIDRRLSLFRQVCHAVHYAHQNLVIHRDIKPGNILVTPDGIPKLLDFGIAKPLDPMVFPNTLAHTTGIRLMTPLYASPEQIRGERVTIASDVYTLGVVLHELLVGCLPYHFEKSGPREIERVICEDFPETPSQSLDRLARLSDAAREQSAARGLEWSQHRSLMSGDLEYIIQMALRKEPRRRYASAEALADDLHRFRVGLPIRARKDTLYYRTGKFLRRNRIAVAIVACFLFMITGFTFSMAIQVDRANNERDKARQALAYLEGFLEAADPGLGRDLTVRQALDMSRTGYEALVDQPELQAMVMNTQGKIYVSLGLHSEARPLLEKAHRILQEDPGHLDFEVLDNLNALGAVALLEGKYEQAEALYREALAMKPRRTDPRVADSFYGLGNTLLDQMNLLEAEDAHRTALSMRRQLLGEQHQDVAHSMCGLARALLEKGDYSGARPLLEKAADLYSRLYDENHLYVGIALGGLGALLHEQSAYDEAEPILRRALSIKKSFLEPDHREVRSTLNTLAIVLAKKGRYDEGIAFQREVLISIKNTYGETHPFLARSMHNLASALFESGRCAEAATMSQNALEVAQRSLGNSHPGVAFILDASAKIAVTMGNPHTAEPLIKRSLEIRHESLPAGHWMIAHSMSHLGTCLGAMEMFADAEQLLTDSYRILAAVRGRDDLDTQRTAAAVIKLYEAWNKPEKAALYREHLSQPDT